MSDRVFGSGSSAADRRKALATRTVKPTNKVWVPFPWQKKVFDTTKTKNRIVLCKGRRAGGSELSLRWVWGDAVSKADATFWWVSLTGGFNRTQIIPRFTKMFRHNPEWLDLTMLDGVCYLKNGSRIIFVSGESKNLDRLLGAGLDGCVIDEAARQHPDLYDEYIEPMLLSNNGRALFTSTPKGFNWFYKLYELGQSGNQNWASFRFPSSVNPEMTEEKLKDIKSRIPDLKFREQYLAEFVSNSGSVFNGIQDCSIEYDEFPIPFDPDRDYTVGVDLARRYDFTVITVMDDDGRVVYTDRNKDILFKAQKHRVKTAVDLYGGAPVYLDATGMGLPFVEELTDLDLDVIPVVLNSSKKEAVIQNLKHKIEIGAITYPADSVYEAELGLYEATELAGGGIRYESTSGHDDAVISLALAAWGHRSSGGTTGLWVL